MILLFPSFTLFREQHSVQPALAAEGSSPWLRAQLPAPSPQAALPCRPGPVLPAEDTLFIFVVVV